MGIIYLLSAIIAVLGVFIGLIIIIKGFAYKSNKNINLGTILVSIGLIIALSGAFCIAQRANHFRKKMMHQRQMMMKECMKDCDMEMMKACCPDSMSVDSNGVKIVTKVIMNKECEKKCKEVCKGHK